jgi:hypothetical protein
MISPNPPRSIIAEATETRVLSACTISPGRPVAATADNKATDTVEDLRTRKTSHSDARRTEKIVSSSLLAAAMSALASTVAALALPTFSAAEAASYDRARIPGDDASALGCFQGATHNGVAIPSPARSAKDVAISEPSARATMNAAVIRNNVVLSIDAVARLRQVIATGLQRKCAGGEQGEWDSPRFPHG